MSSDALPHPDRVHRLEGALNLRDLGGLVGSDGRRVRRGRMFRSEYPGFADLADGAAVRSLGLRTVVDLRRGTEMSFECVPWAEHGVDHHRFPLSAGGESSWRARYHAYLTSRPDTVVEAVRLVTTAAAHPVLFHCAAGKDRTGVVAALVLLVLGVSEEEVVADYVLTETSLDLVLERLASAGPYAEMLAGSSLDDQLPRARNMQGLIDWLAERGGAREWLQANGLSHGHLETFREQVLER
ncbi:tyrosine-protein phosphatase [Nocardioides seonyuensis]|uniref:Tyrosine-protein phosphatase n=1 Tax=Nocardioides seonyuensis TaxID=2518371 RepID=A0A4P7IH18_9ACTN|nr:tyrosine-protein phosphatase [Nocardioides seonyuensis]QBX55963.1 tyrosine-protein phosphatase [Nocardioides seonyuensis]